jgi:glutamyl-tRNA reductase
MNLSSLRVLHQSKKGVKSLHPAISGHSDMVFLETCQRWLWIANSEELVQSYLALEGIEVYRGIQAYSYLLRLASGLESEILGETDIFGQIKAAWRTALQTKTKLISDLSPWMQRVFEDTKEIRTRYMQNLGGASYGTLVRKLIKDLQSVQSGPILLIGAGQIAHSIGPFLLDSEVWLWNRDPLRLESFYEELSQRPRARVKKLVTREEEARAWREAAQIVVCIPTDPVADVQRTEWLKEGSSQRAIIHLGTLREQSGVWQSLPQFQCLTDLFALQVSMSNIRSVQIAQAQKACEEKAKLRALGASLSICHGWEDLVCFA